MPNQMMGKTSFKLKKIKSLTRLRQGSEGKELFLAFYEDQISYEQQVCVFEFIVKPLLL